MKHRPGCDVTATAPHARPAARRNVCGNIAAPGHQSRAQHLYSHRACHWLYSQAQPMAVLPFLSWGLILQAIALVHFFQRRPEAFWFWVIVFLGPLGATIYIVVEIVPDLGLLRHSFDAFGRRKRIRTLEAVVLQNPASGNYEELADLYLDDRKYAKAREYYDKAITPRSDIDPIYRRGIAEVHLGDFAAAVKDLELVAAKDPKYDLHRAIALLAHSYANTGEPEKAEALFRQATEISTISETYLNYAAFLAAQNRNAEAREWAEKVLAKKPAMPLYLQRRERPWFRRAKALLKKVPA